MEDEPQAEDQPAGVDEETETVGPEDGDEAELTPAESPGWRKKRRDRRDLGFRHVAEGPAEQKVRGFVQARQAIKARNLSRGFYNLKGKV